jgi:hypothetical protein
MGWCGDLHRYQEPLHGAFDRSSTTTWFRNTH